MKKIFNIDKKTELIIGLNNELKCMYIYNRFIQTEESIVFLVNSLYEATNIYQSLLHYTKDVYLFPMDEFLTSEAIAISPELKTTRLETIQSIIKKEKKIIVTNLMGYLRFLPPKKQFVDNKIIIRNSKEYKIPEIVLQLNKIGYKREVIVNKTGDFAVRGFVLDIFPINENNPIRLEFWGDTIESIRVFDVDTQKTIKTINQTEIYPNTEFLVDSEVDIDNITQKDICKYLKPVNIVSYFNNCKVIVDNYNEIEISYKLLLEEMLNYQKSLNLNNVKYMHDLYDLPKNYLYLMRFDNGINKIENKLIYNSKDIEPFSNKKELINNQLNNYLFKTKKVIICMSDSKIVNKLIDELENNNIVYTSIDEIIDNKINVIVKKINSGFELPNLVVISENEIFNKKNSNQQYKSRFKIGTKINDLTKINIGDYIVHEVHGIARYAGIEKIKKNDLYKDYLCLEYYGNDKIYVPVEKIETVKKYSNNSSITPKLTRLGSSEWAKAKLRVKKKVEDIAFSLLQLYAERESAKGFAFLKDGPEQLEFEKEFKYTDTLDQIKVTEEIKKEMEKSTPMDRLLCGDVGFGKTEVAFRAMFKAVLSDKQAALLCPTTILSSQHYNNAIERFKSFAVNVVLLNRFVSKSETTKIIKDIKSGKIDVVIGTHRILSDDIQFKDLGLLVIDEEQRFGVKHKEKIKKYKTNIDVLTLTATPIPRTLQMTFTGIRSLSLIQTPPVNRYPIQTYVMAYNNQIIKDAIYKEKSRNGQIFILYNNIENMYQKEIELKNLLPDLRITSAHGKMSKNGLEKIMMDFYNHQYDVLICTTIIETGIDIPKVNTLIIIDADRFGLSQLYQIRGRVGRSNKIAYCYLMYDNRKILSEIATKRLKVIKDFTELGSGFSIAMRDLSIRGAGDILGSEQAGFVDTVGIEMFLNMLNIETKKLKGEEIEEPIEIETLPLLEVDTSIRDEYVDEEELKIEIHNYINSIDSYEKLYEVKSEIEDRFGPIDEKLLIYMYEQWFEKLAQKLNITKIKQTKNFIEIEIPEKLTSKLIIQKLFIDVLDITRMFRFGMKKNKLLITLDTLKLDKHFIYYLIELLVLIEKDYT
ncbi:MAG: transcription-repair coupling factor [Bacilli bacterium]|nr:transcription-repair coupling factor [Bacilli bacterium]MDD4282229.1 transcription-repair coupling factor [Bacilli bacterium]MDD4718228.1 transcription-repair coupling factor [Bacilli bacterium]